MSRQPSLLRDRFCLAAVVALVATLVVETGLAGQGVTGYRILVTNDDGVRAPGLLALAQALTSVGDVTIVAPADNQTGKGHSISITDPIYAEEVTLPGGLAALALTATPASCVKVAVAAVMPARPHVVVSGINRGYNLGMVTYVSGTVGAAREAALQGIPAVASSMAGEGHPDYAVAARETARVVEMVKVRGLPAGVFLNVNVPAGAVKGFRMTRQSSQTGTETFERHENPRGRRYYWNSYRDPAGDAAGTDVWATEQGYVAITPLHTGEFDERVFEAWKDVNDRE